MQNVKYTLSLTPFLTLAVVGMIVARFGFGVKLAWWLILAPFWVPLALSLGIFVFAAMMIAAFAGFAAWAASRYS